MRWLPWQALVLCATGCTIDLTPSWAFDPVWLETSAPGEVFGLQTWQIYGPEWDSANRQKHYVCSVLVELTGTEVPCDAEDGCDQAWSLQREVLQSDCLGAVDTTDPLFVSLRRIAFGSPSRGAAAPHPLSSQRSWADYGGGWERHGHAYPEDLDRGEGGGAFTDGHPFTSMPTKAFPFPQ
ncbi:MAG: hypothetical protein KTR31_03350 [Myxococcales bacterium]|nr:hypothetical protein [Myxococcales bacterium]